MKEKEINQFLLLLDLLISCQSGCCIADKYGIVNFLNEFLKFLLRRKMRRAVELCENIIREVLKETRMINKDTDRFNQNNQVIDSDRNTKLQIKRQIQKKSILASDQK